MHKIASLDSYKCMSSVSYDNEENNILFFIVSATFPPPTTTAATFDDTSRSDVEITAMLRESTSKSQVHTVKTTTFFNLNKTFTVGYIQGRTISSQNTTKSASKMSTEGKSLQDNDTSMYTEGVATNNLQTEESTVRPSNIVKTTFRSPFQHEKTTKEESHMGDLSHSSSKPQENLSVSTWVGDGQVGRFFCEPVKAYDISWPIATKGEVVSRPCMVGSGELLLYSILVYINYMYVLCLVHVFPSRRECYGMKVILQ